MKVILLKDVKGVGRRFEEREVAEGYATNFLVPRKLAVPAGTSAAAEIRALKEKEAREKAGQESALNETLAHIAGTTVEIKVNANEQGHLFSKITSEKLGETLKIDPKFIHLDKPIQALGTYEIPVEMAGKRSHFTLEVGRA